MLAGAERIDPMIDAAAVVGETVEATDFDLVSSAACRMRLEGAEMVLGGLECGYGEDLRAPTSAAQIDLVVVGRQPAVRSGGAFEDGARGPPLRLLVHRALRCARTGSGAIGIPCRP